MEIDIHFVTYNGGGGHETLSHVGDFLLLNAPKTFGSAIRTIEIYPRLPHLGRPLKTLGGMLKRHREELATLPQVWKRARGLYQIAYLSRLGTDQSLLEKPAKTPSLRLFRRGCLEIVSALSLIRKRLKPTDDFDFDNFDSFLRRRLEQLPTTASELDAALRVIHVRWRKQAVARHLAKMQRARRRPDQCKIFNCLDFHCQAKVPKALARVFAARKEQIVESFSLRIPRKVKTDFFHKLNVCSLEKTDSDQWFVEMEGIACVDLLTPDISSIYRASRTEAIKRLKGILLKGIRVAAKNDERFAKHLETWKRLIATADQEFDYDLRMARTHPSRRWRGEG